MLLSLIFIKIKEFHTQFYDALYQRNNYTIEYENQNYGIIKLFVSIDEKIFVIVQDVSETKQDFNAKTGNLDINSALNKFSKFYKKIKINNTYSLVDSSKITNKCILLLLPNEKYLTPLVELSEID